MKRTMKDIEGGVGVEMGTGPQEWRNPGGVG